jgi:hypothetical protein
VSRKSRWQRPRNWFFVKEFAGIPTAARFSTSVAVATGASSTAGKVVGAFVVAISAVPRTATIRRVKKVASIIGIVNVSTASA